MTMISKYLSDLREMRERNAGHPEYCQKLIDGCKDLDDKDSMIFAFAVLNAVKDRGYSEGLAASGVGC